MPLLAVLALLVAGCGSPDAEDSATDTTLIDPQQFDGPPVARVDGQPVPEGLLLAYLRMRGQLDADPERRAAALRELVDLLLLAEEAQRQGLLERESLQALLAVQKLSLVANQAIQSYAQANPITDEEIAAEYADKVGSAGTHEYRLRHILTETEAEARQVLERLAAGEAYRDVEAEYAERIGVAAAGEIGWVNLTQVPPGFGPALATVATGEYAHDPVASEYGFHVLFLEDQRTFAPPELEEVQAGIRSSLGRDRLDGYLEQLRAEADIEVLTADG